MPTYDYRCAKCGEDLEVYQTFSEAPLTRHKGCGGKLSKVLSPAGIVLKGSGFYKTDNRSSGKKSSDKGKDSSSNGDSSTKSDTKPDSTKSETKTSSDTKSSGSSSSDSKKPAAKSA
jgi:putative FmdB family regulatory protein